MNRAKYALELIGNMFAFAFSAWLLFMFMKAMNAGGMYWGEPNHLILGLETGLATLMLCIGLERGIDDIKNIHNYKLNGAILEISLDTFLTLGSGLMLGNFIAFYFTNVYWDATYASINMIIAGIMMCIALERLFDDALKD